MENELNDRPTLTHPTPPGYRQVVYGTKYRRGISIIIVRDNAAQLHEDWGG